ncbi:uncharacterized protein F5147DRAFT_716253 [Suillus discolor]|uniref:Secreted protein n=1 Tax=Suillus discolor TaxID=1912936 RepID=A0A9P7EXJ6_9AGAM|nr:uncharacterized protein F5147DRAFT_716253 [Suillus discolor]KAG2096752.1 hypothetical protein F5147DRAFT_716253 [Suillus discolor]
MCTCVTFSFFWLLFSHKVFPRMINLPKFEFERLTGRDEHPLSRDAQDNRLSQTGQCNTSMKRILSQTKSTDIPNFLQTNIPPLVGLIPHHILLLAIRVILL